MKIEIKTKTDIDSLDWQSWLETNSTFHYQPIGNDYGFCARKEIPKRAKKAYWYAYRKINNKQYKAYLGKTEDLTFEKLEAIAIELELAPQLKQNPTSSSRITKNKKDDENSSVNILYNELKQLRAEVSQLREQVSQVQQMESFIKQLQEQIAFLQAQPETIYFRSWY